MGAREVIEWYKAKPQLFSQERDRLTAAQPLMDLEILAPGTRINKHVALTQEAAVALGMYKLDVPGSCYHYRYQIALVLATDYPKRPPVMYCDDPKLPAGNLDRHILNDGQACLGVAVDIASRWSAERGLVGFLDAVVGSFLEWQFCFQAHDKPPSHLGQRPHGVEGILECYRDILGDMAQAEILAFMRLLARKNRPKGHEWCPCGSGRRLRCCHGGALWDAWKAVARWAVHDDLTQLEKHEKHPA